MVAKTPQWFSTHFFMSRWRAPWAMVFQFNPHRWLLYIYNTPTTPLMMASNLQIVFMSGWRVPWAYGVSVQSTQMDLVYLQHVHATPDGGLKSPNRFHVWMTSSMSIWCFSSIHTDGSCISTTHPRYPWWWPQSSKLCIQWAIAIPVTSPTWSIDGKRD